jgi:hypothetical protein
LVVLLKCAGGAEFSSLFRACVVDVLAVGANCFLLEFFEEAESLVITGVVLVGVLVVSWLGVCVYGTGCLVVVEVRVLDLISKRSLLLASSKAIRRPIGPRTLPSPYPSDRIPHYRLVLRRTPPERIIPIPWIREWRALSSSLRVVQVPKHVRYFLVRRVCLYISLGIKRILVDELLLVGVLIEVEDLA